MRILVQHKSVYEYASPAALGPHTFRLRPADHAKAHIESYALHIEPEHRLHWQRDPAGNHQARISFSVGQRVKRLDVTVELVVDIKPVNPFDFFVEEYAETMPFAYPNHEHRALLAYLDTEDPALAMGPAFEHFLESVPATGNTVNWIVALVGAVASRVGYVIREEAGIYTPEETLNIGRGSCRDSAALLVAALRRRGLAARFVSGYLVQLRDEGMLPDEPRGVDRDVVDLHAWAEVYLPGAGWIGLDGTSGLLCGEGHIPLAATGTPSMASPVEGTADRPAASVRFETKVGRVGREISVTTPYDEGEWAQLLNAARRADERLLADGVQLTVGGEPTFNAREDTDAPEWLGDALGPSKWRYGVALARELLSRRAPGGILVRRQGKHYPGESLPRWALDLIWRTDGTPLVSDSSRPVAPTPALLERFAARLSERAGLPGSAMAAYEDPWHFLQQEALLPVDVDPLQADLDDGEERQRLARVLDRGLGAVVGWVLPLNRVGGQWVGGRWAFRRQQLFLVPGDSPIGLRLPLASLQWGWSPPPPLEPAIVDDDPRRSLDDAERQAVRRAPLPPLPGTTIRTAVCLEIRDGAITAFLPPTSYELDYEAMVGLVDSVADELGVPVQFEGYVPPRGGRLNRFAVTPDPGVLEVNLPPATSTAEYAELASDVFDAALSTGLHAEKYLVDGRQQGSGGGNHITLGGPTLLDSPWVQRPDLLASLITFVQHHPSLSYLFTGLFVGPTSQAPRVDEARHDALYELEIALDRAHRSRGERNVPWLGDMLFRHLLVDVSGNTHRAELSIDKLFDPNTPHGRQGLVELRAFEMPPHPRMMVAQVALLRALTAAFVRTPYRHPLVRYGLSLHDRYLLPYYLWRDFEEVLSWLESAGVPLPAAAYRAFLELRCPKVGAVTAEGVHLEVRNALEPWNVLGEEAGAAGTSRYVDSSMERVEVRVRGLQSGRHCVLVNGIELPLHPADAPGDYVAGVRFRAWAPPHSLHAHIGIHHPLRFDLVDRPARRSFGAGAYHVWHPEGRAFDAPPLTRFEAGARRAQRFTAVGPLAWPVNPMSAAIHPDAPVSLDLRRFGIDRPMPTPEAEA